jgi:rhodanese-related sulfurtransferase
MAELPSEKTIWVHCAGAYRASIAASLIQNAGFSVVLINEPYEKVFSVPELPLVTGGTDRGPIAPSDAKKFGNQE